MLPRKQNEAKLTYVRSCIQVEQLNKHIVPTNTHVAVYLLIKLLARTVSLDDDDERLPQEEKKDLERFSSPITRSRCFNICC